jgi:hypothetical protein
MIASEVQDVRSSEVLAAVGGCVGEEQPDAGGVLSAARCEGRHVRLVETEAASRGRGGQAGFVEVALPGGVLASPSSTAVPTLAASWGYEVVLPGGRLIRLPGDFDPDKVSQLLRVVGSAC